VNKIKTYVFLKSSGKSLRLKFSF